MTCSTLYVQHLHAMTSQQTTWIHHIHGRLDHVYSHVYPEMKHAYVWNCITSYHQHSTNSAHDHFGSRNTKPARYSMDPFVLPL